MIRAPASTARQGFFESSEDQNHPLERVVLVLLGSLFRADRTLPLWARPHGDPGASQAVSEAITPKALNRPFERPPMGSLTPQGQSGL